MKVWIRKKLEPFLYKESYSWPSVVYFSFLKYSPFPFTPYHTRSQGGSIGTDEAPFGPEQPSIIQQNFWQITLFEHPSRNFWLRAWVNAHQGMCTIGPLSIYH